MILLGTFHIQTTTPRKFKWPSQRIPEFVSVTTLLTFKCSPLGFLPSRQLFHTTESSPFLIFSSHAPTLAGILCVLLICGPRYPTVTLCQLASSLSLSFYNHFCLLCGSSLQNTQFFVYPMKWHLSPLTPVPNSLWSEIALGHLLDCTGVFTMFAKLKTHGKKTDGLVSMCSGTGIQDTSVF